MLIIGWKGTAIPDNRRLIPQRGANARIIAGKLLKTKKRRLTANPEYKAFKEGLAWEIRAQTREKYRTINLMISFELATRPKNQEIDKQNLLKPICDAVELSGLIKDDKQIGVIMLMPVVESKDRADHLYLFINGEKR